jgi:D-3-phosphoglycerate dehydrogenase
MSLPHKVLVASRSFGKDCPGVLSVLRDAGCELTLIDLERPPTEEELLARIGGADALISGTEPVTARVIAAAPRLKVISKHGVGFDNVDLAAACARGIVVAVCDGPATDSVADMTLALLLSVARQIPQANAAVKQGRWKRFVGPELRGKTLGIVGLGRIGRAVAERAKGFGMRLVAHDVREEQALAEPHGITYLTLDELLATSDFVTLHAPLVPETRGLIGAARLRRMKPTAILVNTARGELVDEDALYEALKTNVIAGAATDVFVREPPGPSHPLLTLDNFIATPHSAAQTPEGLRRMGETCAHNVLRVLRGEKPLFSAGYDGPAAMASS